MDETRIIHGNALDLPLEDNSVDLVVTSPPYFALRSYRDEGGHYGGQIGSEATPQEFLEALWAATREMVRVLKPTGSIFVNLGDKYAGSGGHNNSNLTTPPASANSTLSGGKRTIAGASTRNAPNRYNQNSGGIPAKSLMGLPWRYAIGCVDQLDLILRAEVVWSKPNGLPESVTDRVRRSHEQWFHFVKSPRYFSAVDEIREGYAAPWATRTDGKSMHARGENEDRWRNAEDTMNPLGKLPGSVWTIPSEPLIIPEAVAAHYHLPDHFAAFPQEWPRRIILGWSPSGICTKCGEGRRPVSEITAGDFDSEAERDRLSALQRERVAVNGGAVSNLGRRDVERIISGHACACDLPIAPIRPAVILDPFCGTGTVPMVARSLDRVGIGVELSRDYCRLAEWRVFRSGHGDKAERRTWAERQLGLL